MKTGKPLPGNEEGVFFSEIHIALVVPVTGIV